ncbi:MAG TPA: 50S ribosomal protein L11 methyltransferase [Gemmatimonadaceae bacterium]|nr:50S ribosomal protein L11 methyltransferase [Gemmatimonadaceae bacterium]
MTKETRDAAWITVRISPGARRDDVLAALFEAGAAGVQEFPDALVTHAHGLADASRLERAALAIASDVVVQTEPLAISDWSERWKHALRAQRVGRLTIAPPWLGHGLDPATTIVIEPGMAFGTGDHATTQSVVRLLQNVARDGDRVADVGTGSAVLAIAAAKLGASRVVAIELDPDAIENAEENVRRNGVDDRVSVVEGDAASLLPLVAPVRIVTANIISSVLIDLLPTMRTALDVDGCAILSGILTSERALMLDRLAAAGWRIVEEIEEGEWWSATVEPR